MELSQEAESLEVNQKAALVYLEALPAPAAPQML